MKVHITNQYGCNNRDIAESQRKLSTIGRKLGFYEMGILIYDVDSDSESELSKRLDGIIAAIEHDDLVIVQLPTGNGQKFEELLMQKILAYSGRKVLLIWNSYEYRLQYAEKYAAYASNENMALDIKNTTDLEVNKFLLDMVGEAQKREHNYMQADDSTDYTDDFIHIGFGLYDKNGTYSVWVGTAMQSVIETTDAVVMFHILHDDTLTDDNRSKLIQVAKSGGHKIQFHYFDSTIFDEIKEMVGIFTIGAMFRIMLPDILPKLDRIIYLDADLFVNRDIEELWKTDISNFCIAAVKDMGIERGVEVPYPVLRGQVEADNYFNTGILYINLKNIREQGKLCEETLAYLRSNKEAKFPDQDAFNVLFKNKCRYLDESWNCFAKYARETDKKCIGNKIYHYAGAYLKLYYANEIDYVYFEVLNRTPWEKVEGKNIADSSMGRTVDRANQLESLLRRIAKKGSKYVFYGPQKNSMKNMMSKLDANEDNSICIEKFDESISDNKEDYIILVLPDAEEWKGIGILEKNGLRNGSDFFVIPRLLHVSQGGYL